MSKQMSGQEVAAWPEFISFAERLGIDLDLPTSSITIRLALDEVVKIRQIYLGVDNGPIENTVFDVYNGYETTFLKTFYDIGSNSDTKASIEADGAEIHPLYRNPVDSRSYTVHYDHEGSSIEDLKVGGTVQANIKLDNSTHKVRPIRPEPDVVHKCNPDNFVDKLQEANSAPSSEVHELRLVDGNYELGSLSIVKDNITIVAPTNDSLFYNLMNPSIVWSLVAGTNSVYEATLGQITTSLFWNDEGTLRRLSEGAGALKSAWTDETLDAAPIGGWFYDGKLKVKIPTGEKPNDNDIYYSNSEHEICFEVSGDNCWIEGIDVVGYSPKSFSYKPESGIIVTGSNFVCVDCGFSLNKQNALTIRKTDNFYVNGCSFEDDFRFMTRPMTRNGSIHQFIGGGIWIDRSSKGIIRNCSFEEIHRPILVQAYGDCQVNYLEIHSNHFERCFNALVDIRSLGGCISIINNTSDLCENGMLNLEEEMPTSPVYWINNNSIRCGWAGHTTYNGQSPKQGALNRYGGTSNPASKGYLGPHFVYHNTYSVTETHTETYTSNNGWISARRKFKPDSQTDPATYFQNNIIVSLKDTDSAAGNYAVVYAAGSDVEAGEKAAKGIKWEGNQYWVVGGEVDEKGFNFRGIGQEDFDTTKEMMESNWGVTWEEYGAYLDPELDDEGEPNNPNFTGSDTEIPGVTNNDFLDLSPRSGSSKLVRGSNHAS